MDSTSWRLSPGNLVSHDERHLKVKALDPLEYLLLWLCGLLLMTFTTAVFLDVVTRILAIPLLWLQEATLTAFIWGLFLGAAVALRRNEHIYVASFGSKLAGKWRLILETFNMLVLLAVCVTVAYYGYINFQRGFGNTLPVTGMPLAYIIGAVPVFGACATVFILERLVMGWRNGFEGSTHDVREQAIKAIEEYKEGTI